MAQIVGIYRAPDKGASMEYIKSAVVLKGLGLEGDRYAMQKGSWMNPGALRHRKKRNVTLISCEAIHAANKKLDEGKSFGARHTRRNILTLGIDLNTLIGKKFAIGTVQFLGVEHAKPCSRPDKLAHKKGFKKAFQGNGGLNAKVLMGGTINVGDQIHILN